MEKSWGHPLKWRFLAGISSMILMLNGLGLSKPSKLRKTWNPWTIRAAVPFFGRFWETTGHCETARCTPWKTLQYSKKRFTVSVYLQNSSIPGFYINSIEVQNSFQRTVENWKNRIPATHLISPHLIIDAKRETFPQRCSVQWEEV